VQLVLILFLLIYIIRVLKLTFHNLNLFISEPSLLGAPVRRDLRNQNSGQPPLLSRIPAAIPLSSLQPQGGWLVEEDTSRAQSNNRPSATAQELDSLKSDKLRGLQNPLAHGASASAPAPSSLVSHASELKAEEVCLKLI
jgi:RNA polymerase II C-terminal domain phosphatase-like 1/2